MRPGVVLTLLVYFQAATADYFDHAYISLLHIDINSFSGIYCNIVWEFRRLANPLFFIKHALPLLSTFKYGLGQMIQMTL
jgi:hypothetical protein